MTTSMVEPEWDVQTRSAALALDLYEDSLCPLCRQPSHICQDPAKQFDWRSPDPTRCHATTALLNKQKGYTDETHPPAAALLFGVQLNEGVK